MTTEKEIKQKMKKLRRKVVLILNKNRLYQAKYESRMIRGAGQYITDGYVISEAISFFTIHSTNSNIFESIKKVLIENKILFTEANKFGYIDISIYNNIPNGEEKIKMTTDKTADASNLTTNCDPLPDASKTEENVDYGMTWDYNKGYAKGKSDAEKEFREKLGRLKKSLRQCGNLTLKEDFDEFEERHLVRDFTFIIIVEEYINKIFGDIEGEKSANPLDEIIMNEENSKWFYKGMKIVLPKLKREIIEYINNFRLEGDDLEGEKK